MVGFSHYQPFLDQLKNTDYVKAATPIVKSIGTLTRLGRDENIAVEIMGIDIASIGRVTNFHDTLYYSIGNPQNAFIPRYAPTRTGFIAGIGLMGNKDKQGGYSHSASPINLDVEISCVPLTAKGAMQKADTDFVNSKVFYFSDDSHSKIAKIDGRVIYLPIADAQMLCGMGGNVKRVSALFIKFNDGIDVQQGTNDIRQLWNAYTEKNSSLAQANLFQSVTVNSWKQYLRDTIAPMEKEQTMLIVLFAMVGFTTVFIVFVIFYMLISHKSKDIGILRSIGVSSCNVVKMFVTFATLIALEGFAIGVLAGWWFLANINALEQQLYRWKGWQVFDRSVYAIDDLPNEITPTLLLSVLAASLIACIAGALLPALRAAARKPAEILSVTGI